MTRFCPHVLSPPTYAYKHTEILNSNQSKLADEVEEFKQQNVLMNNQIQELNTRLHMGGIGGVCVLFLLSTCNPTSSVAVDWSWEGELVEKSKNIYVQFRSASCFFLAASPLTRNMLEPACGAYVVHMRSSQSHATGCLHE